MRCAATTPLAPFTGVSGRLITIAADRWTAVDETDGLQATPQRSAPGRTGWNAAARIDQRPVRPRGREPELAALALVVAELVAGRGASLLVSGEAGAGKTCLLETFAAEQRLCRYSHVAAVESETELAYAGLHQLCQPILGLAKRLPTPQQSALAAVFGRAEEAPADPFLVGLAVLGLLTEAAAEQPLLCVVDDSHWLDRASLRTLAFVARRLHAESVALVFVVREPPAELRGLPELRLEGLPDASARELLGGALQGPVDVEVRDRLLAEAQGNPLALLQLAHMQQSNRSGGGFVIPTRRGVGDQIEARFIEQVRRLAADEQLLLLLAAAEPTGDPVLLNKAAGSLGVRVPAHVTGRLSELIDITPRVRFRHPLIRSAVYGSAGEQERMDAHRAIGEATAPTAPDRQAWHLSLAIDRTDEAVAARLEQSATDARSRGGLAASAAFLARAAQLTPDSARRAQRSLEAAAAELHSGGVATARALLAAAEAGPLSSAEKAKAVLLRSQIAFYAERADPDVLLAAADGLREHDPELSRETYFEALMAGTFAGRLMAGDSQRHLAARILKAAPPAASPRPIDLLLDGWATCLSAGPLAGTPLLRRAADVLLAEERPSPESRRWMWSAMTARMETLDDGDWAASAERQVDLLRESGELVALGIALVQLGAAELLRGDFVACEAHFREAIAVADATFTPPPKYALVVLEGWRGRRGQTRQLAADVMREANATGEGTALMLAEHALAVLGNGRGEYRDALEAVTTPTTVAPHSYGSIVLFEFVEAAVRSGDVGAAERGLRALVSHARGTEGRWGRGVRACAEALCADGAAAEPLYVTAVAEFQAGRILPYLGRARLLYGEWLRRQGRRIEARRELRAALDLLADIGCEAFAQRAARELQATGVRSRRRRAEARDDLTPQETQIARMAASGMSNREIGQELFLSHRTVATHLYRAFPKLGVTGRGQLHEALRALTTLAR